MRNQNGLDKLTVAFALNFFAPVIPTEGRIYAAVRMQVSNRFLTVLRLSADRQAPFERTIGFSRPTRISQLPNPEPQTPNVIPTEGRNPNE